MTADRLGTSFGGFAEGLTDAGVYVGAPVPSHARHYPNYRVDGKILIRRSEFDVWIAAYRRVGDTEVDQIVDDVLAKLD